MPITITLTGQVPATINASWGFGDCNVQPGDTLSFNYTLWKDGVSYDTDNQTGVSKTWSNVPTGNYYLSLSAILNGAPCDSGQSVEIFIGNYCLPTSGTLSMGKLADFYGIPRSSALLSGPNNPSTSGSIFGNSNLPSTGTISKSTPNAISELYGRCGGVQSYNAEDGTNNIIEGRLASSNFFAVSFQVRLNTSGGTLLASGVVSSQGCSYYKTTKEFFTTPVTAFYVTFTIQNPNSILEEFTVAVGIYQIGTSTQYIQNYTNYNQQTDKTYTYTSSLSLDTSLKYKIIIYVNSLSCPNGIF